MSPFPHMAGNMGATVEEGTWVVTSYLVSNAIILPMAGWLANRFGRRRMLMLCVTGFTLTSLLCGMATSLEWLIFFRVLQGLTGGGLQPLSQSVLLETFPPKKHGTAMAAFGLGIILAPILGPTLGGWITDNYTWRWIFYLNLPVGIFSLLMISAVRARSALPRQAQDRRRRPVGHRISRARLRHVADGARSPASARTGSAATRFACGPRSASSAWSRMVIRELTAKHPDRRPARAEGPHLQRRHLPHDDAGLRALRQPDAAADLPADAAGLSGAAIGTGAVAARHRLAGHDAHQSASSPIATIRASCSSSASWSAAGPCSASRT